MTMRRSVLLMLGLAAVGVSLPLGLSACGQPPDASEERQESKKDDRKEAPPAEARKADQAKEKEPRPADFRLPDDSGGRLVLRVLTPPDRPPDREGSKPRPRRSPRAVENPNPPLPPQVASLPRLPEAGLRKPLPQLVAPEPLFGLEEIIGALPQAVSFPAQERVRLASPDVSRPVDLPRMAQPLPDRGALTDPTADASLSAALSAPLPARGSPAPFQRFTLPDPFENHETVKLTKSPGEEPLPDTSSSPPRK
jgi:hypothetical protein